MKEVLIVGPSVKLKGGVATVIKNYKKINFSDKNINVKYFETIHSTNKYINMAIFPIIISLFIINIINKDIIHIHMASYGSFKRKAILTNIAKLFNKKIILHIHGAEFHLFYNKSSKLYKIYITKILNKANFIIALSDEWKIRLSKISNTQISVIYNSVSVYEKNYNEFGNRITFMGRMDKRKGIYDLIQISKKIYQVNKNLIITLCGDGELDKVKKYILDNEICNVDVVGWIGKDMKEKILSETIINILPSYNEGMPMSILEAMAKGIPTISTTVGGIPEVIEHAKNSFLVTPGDKDSMIKIIEELISNVKLRREISSRAYSTINSKFNINAHISSLVNIYEKI